MDKMVFKKFITKAKDIDILANLPDGLLLIDNDGKIEWVNDKILCLLEMSKNDLFKLNFAELIENGIALTNQAVISEKPTVGRAIRPSGKDLYLELSAKKVDGFIAVSVRDVTQNHKAVTNILVEHESSKKINKDKNTFLVKLSNELKSPVHSIIGFSQAMVDGLGGEMSEKQEKYIKIINKNSNDMLYLFDKILELSKTESNLFEHDFQVFDVINTIQSIIKNNEPQIKDKNLNLKFDSTDIFKRTIFSDEASLKVMLQNVLETSIHSTDIGSITIKTLNPDLELVKERGLSVPGEFTEKAYLQIIISDTGAGVAENDLGVLFDPYAQLDRPNKKNIVKSIALASAKNLIKYLKGSIWVESEPMQGTKYNIIIPIEKFSN